MELFHTGQGINAYSKEDSTDQCLAPKGACRFIPRPGAHRFIRRPMRRANAFFAPKGLLVRRFGSQNGCLVGADFGATPFRKAVLNGFGMK